MKLNNIYLGVFVFLLMESVSAVDVSTDSYNLSATHMGVSGSDISTNSYSARDTITHQQAGTGDIETSSYSANAGWYVPTSQITIDEDTTPTTDTTTGNAGGSAGGSAEVSPGVVMVTNATEEKQLFDITWNLEDALISDIGELEGVITFTSFGNVPTLVNLTFTILDENKNEVYRGVSDITVMTEEVMRWNFEGLELSDGKYTAVLGTLYNGDVYDEFRQDFEIGRSVGITGNVVGWVEGEGKWWASGLFALVSIGGLVWWGIRKIKFQKHWIKKVVKKVSFWNRETNNQVGKSASRNYAQEKQPMHEGGSD